MKKALIFSPYFKTLGGGEVYSLSFAKCLELNGYQVDFAADELKFLSDVKKRLDITFDKPGLNQEAYKLFTNKSLILSKYSRTFKYDLTFFVSDGSLPFLFSKNNLVHFQVPFTKLSASFSNKLKLASINHIVCNSHFTKKVVDQKLNINSTVLYPPVNIKHPTKKHSKKNIILNVGRFTDTLHNKRQDIMLEVFKNLVDDGLSGWQLVLIGSDSEGQALVKKLKKQAKGYPVKIITNISQAELVKYYYQSKIFWLATGFGIDETVSPELVEHFGIAPVEAMTAGSVPIAIDKGGPKEVITPNTDGFLFSNKKQLADFTLKLINSEQLRQKMSKQAQATAQKFTFDQFCSSAQKLLK